MCHYIRDNSFILTNCWLKSVSISETTLLFPHTVGYTVSVYQTQPFCPQRVLVTVCHCFCVKIIFPTNNCLQCFWISGQHFFLPHCLLHSFSISDTKLYPDTLFVTLCHFIGDNSIIINYWWLFLVGFSETTNVFSPTVGYTVSGHKRQPFFRHIYLCLHFVSIAVTTYSSSPTLVYTI